VNKKKYPERALCAYANQCPNTRFELPQAQKKVFATERETIYAMCSDNQTEVATKNKKIHPKIKFHTWSVAPISQRGDFFYALKE
jgi:hypothetical protein